jgi:hypothetical protein
VQWTLDASPTQMTTVTRLNLDGLSKRLVDVWNAQLHGIFLKLALFRVTQPFCTNVPGSHLQISPYLQIYRSVSPDLQFCIVTTTTELYIQETPDLY